MGKVTELLLKLREMPAQQLFDRFKHIARAQAVREYLATKEDKDLTIEVNLAGEEIVRRMSTGRSFVTTSKIKKTTKK